MSFKETIGKIDDLRRELLRDLLSLTLVPGWQTTLYQACEGNIKAKRYGDKYRPMFERMRDYGITVYSPRDMDVSAIVTVICYVNNTVSLTTDTKRIIRGIREDRNASTPHLTGSEYDEELFARGLLALIKLKELVRQVDEFEVSIDEVKRLDFRQKYIKQVDDIKAELCGEYMELLVVIRDVDRDIERILNEPDDEKRQKLYYFIQTSYMEHYRVSRTDPLTEKRYYTFLKRASDKGIVRARKDVLLIASCYGDSEELEKQLGFLLDETGEDESRYCIEQINCYHLMASEKRTVTPGLEKIVQRIIERGHRVTKDNDGCYVYEE
jgi:hypothetical protein